MTYGDCSCEQFALLSHQVRTGVYFFRKYLYHETYGSTFCACLRKEPGSRPRGHGTSRFSYMVRPEP